MCALTFRELVVSAEVVASLEASERTGNGLVLVRFSKGVWHFVSAADCRFGDRFVFARRGDSDVRFASRAEFDAERARLERIGFQVSQQSEDEAHHEAVLHRGWDGARARISAGDL